MDYQEAPIVVKPITDGFHISILGPIHTNVQWLEFEFDKVIKAAPKLVELDLAKMNYTSSLGLGVLVKFRTGVAKAGGALKTVAIDKKVYQMLKISRLADMFNVDPAALAG